ncbi:glycosyltransferase family 4 protein [Hydrogenimonas sp.]
MNHEKLFIRFVRQKHTAYGGAERYLQRLGDALERRGIETETVHSELPKSLPSWLKALLFDRYVCSLGRPISSPHVRPILFSLDRISCPDIYRAGDGVHKAFLKTKGFTLNPLHLAYLRLEKRTFQNAKIVIANSRLVRNQILEHYEIDEEKIRVIYNGVPIPSHVEKKRAKEELAREFGIDPNIPIILFVGSGFERKGVAEFISTLALLKNDFNALIVGKDKRVSRYRQMAQKIGLGRRILFTGPRKDVERFHEAADIFLFPTRYEPFSNVVLEALSYETPVFTTLQNGASEILPKPYLMRDPEDISIVGTIDLLLENPEALRRAGEEAGKIAERYSIERNVDETLAVIEEFAKISHHENR